MTLNIQKNCDIKITCECNTFYIGASSRSLVKTNENCIKMKKFEKSKIREHVWENGHGLQFLKPPFYTKEKTREDKRVCFNLVKRRSLCCTYISRILHSILGCRWLGISNILHPIVSPNTNSWGYSQVFLMNSIYHSAAKFQESHQSRSTLTL